MEDLDNFDASFISSTLNVRAIQKRTKLIKGMLSYDYSEKISLGHQPTIGQRLKNKKLSTFWALKLNFNLDSFL